VRVFCGIDWAESHHDVAVVDAEGRSLACRRIRDDAAGYQQLLQLLAEAGDTATDPIPVAIQTSRGLLVAFLRATGRRVYAINPLAVSRYRDRHGVAGTKSDHARRGRAGQHLAHRPRPRTGPCRPTLNWSRRSRCSPRAQQDAVWNRQQLAMKLRSLLREFFPAALAAFHPKARRPDRPSGPRRAGPWPRRPRPRQRA
jgi:Transposase